MVIRYVWVLYILLTPLHPQALAALGGDGGALRDEAYASGTRESLVVRAGYERHEIALPKYVLHQFVGPDGRVFAVAWSGKSHPDLGALMGEHLQGFRQALAQGRAGRHGRFPVKVDSGGLHLELSSHGRSVSGRAWLIDRVPAGVSADELR